MMRFSAILAVTVGGCGACGGGADSGEPPPALRGETSGREGEPSAPIPAELPTEPPTEPPTVRLVVEVGSADSIQLRVESRGDVPADLASTVRIERESGAGWVVASSEFFLRTSCADPVSDCVTLVPGAEFLPPIWRGEDGQGQCDCERCVESPSGTYRFVATSCNGQHSIEGEPFSIER